LGLAKREFAYRGTQVLSNPAELADAAVTAEPGEGFDASKETHVGFSLGDPHRETETDPVAASLRKSLRADHF